MSNGAANILTVDGLDVRYGAVRAVSGVSFSVAKGEVLGIVGESGSGKSTVLRSVAALLGPGGRIAAGEVRIAGRSVTGLSQREFARLRGAQVAYVFQDPVSSLDPLFTVGEQFAECLAAVGASAAGKGGEGPAGAGASGSAPGSAAEPARVAPDALAEMGFSDPERVLASYPHQLSGGMCQRAVLAMAAALSPCVLLADEPTSALDTVSQASVLAALRRLRDEGRMGIVLVSHDIGVVRAVADRVGVMKDGALVEMGSAQQVLEHPQHPYTQRLINAVPTGDGSLLEREAGHVAGR